VEDAITQHLSNIPHEREKSKEEKERKPLLFDTIPLKVLAIPRACHIQQIRFASLT
jgi:hypothetical protein